MKIWISQHAAALKLATRRLVNSPASTLLAALAIGIALALPAGGQLLFTSLQQLGQGSTATPQISVFMTQEAAAKQVADVSERLAAHPGIQSVTLLKKEDTLARMRKAEGLAAIIDALPKNPFPDAFVVLPRDDSPAAMEALRAELAKLPRVEHVQLDSAWAQRLALWLKLGRTLVWILATLFGAGLLALIFNTIRLQVLTQRAEIEVSRLLGATDAYIGRPFYYFGALQSFAGAIVALLIVDAAAALLRTPVAELAALYNLDFALGSLRLVDSIAILLVAAALGWLGAALSVRRQLWRL